MYSDDIAISVRALTKSYRLFDHPGDRIKQFLTLGLKRYHRAFTALSDVTLDIRRGETIGIIGRNGSGKSTLLQLVCGILKPTSGTIRVKGRISALLELGSGFNPEFTGRENIYFQGLLMGFSKMQMAQRFDGIAAFADIGDFIDQPVRMYSSGMFVRLAFAVAVSVDPDILVVDEALAVGDAGYRARCFRRIGQLRGAGCTILFVSHDMEQVAALCDRVVLLDRGQQLMFSMPEVALEGMSRLANASVETRDVLREQIRLIKSGLAERFDDASVLELDGTEAQTNSGLAYQPNGALIAEVRLVDASGRQTQVLSNGQIYRCGFIVRFTENALSVRFAMLIKTDTGMRLGGTKTLPSGNDGLPNVSQGSCANVNFKFRCALNTGTYLLSVAAYARIADVEFALHGIKNAVRFQVAAANDGQALGAVDFEIKPSIVLDGAMVT